MRYFLFLISLFCLPLVSFASWDLYSDAPDNVTYQSTVCPGYPGWYGILSYSFGVWSYLSCSESFSSDQTAVDSAYSEDNSVLPNATNFVQGGLVFSAISECAGDGITPWSQVSTCEGSGTTTPTTTPTTGQLTDYTLDFGVGILIVMASILFSGMVFNYMTDKERTNNQEII